MSGAEVVAQLTGPGSLNRTDEIWDVHGTDLGHMFWHDARLYMVFGDTFDAHRRNWRSNVVALISNPVRPEQGLRFADMTRDDDGRAREVLGSGKGRGGETTVIPTYGVSTGEQMVLHWMSVRSFDKPGHWRTNSSGLAVADGERWRVLDSPRWAGDSNFAQVCFVPVPRDDTYVLGIPAGRFGHVCLARVPAGELTDAQRWRYWDGAAWVGDERAAVPVVPAPAGELSVHYSDYHQRWLFMTLNEDRAAIVLRLAERLVGPWSEERVIATAGDYPQLYAPYLVPMTIAGPEIYFTMSRFDTYNVFLMRTRLP